MMGAAEAPELRFPEFTNPWRDARGGDAFLPRRAAGTSDLPLYSVTIDNGLVRRDSLEREILSNAADESNLRAEPDDIVYNMMRMWQGAVGRAPEACMISPAYVVLAPRPDTSSRFFEQWCKRPRSLHLLGAYSQGLTKDRLRLYYRDFARIPMRLPERAEQDRIAEALAALDTRIGQFEREAELFARFKQGLAQQLFSGRQRFTRHDGSPYGDWTDVKLGEVATFRKGRGLSREDVAERGATPCIRYGELYTTYTENITVVASYTDVDPGELLLSEPGDVILPASGEMPIDMASAACVAAPGVALGGDINVLRSTLDGLFLAYLLRTTRRREIARLAQGNSVVHLYGHHLATLTFRAPTDPEEQAKIAAALAAVDERIAAARRQARALGAFKAGLMQKMFV